MKNIESYPDVSKKGKTVPISKNSVTMNTVKPISLKRIINKLKISKIKAKPQVKKRHHKSIQVPNTAKNEISITSSSHSNDSESVYSDDSEVDNHEWSPGVKVDPDIFHDGAQLMAFLKAMSLRT